MSNYEIKACITQADANVMGFPKLFLFHLDNSGYNVTKTLWLPQITLVPHRHHKMKKNPYRSDKLSTVS